MKAFRVIVFLVTAMGNLQLGHAEAESHACPKPAGEEALIQRSDFPWDQSLEEISNLSDQIHQSGKRLPDRAYVEGSQLVLPVNADKAYSWGFTFTQVQVEMSFLANIKNHISDMRKNKFGTELIYSDLGHAHVFASAADMELLKNKNVSSDDAEYHEFLFESENIKILYHTAEQLRDAQTEGEQWRKDHRTLVGDAHGKITPVSYTKSLEGHSQIFNLYFNTSKNGCFSLDAEKFDISFESPE